MQNLRPEGRKTAPRSPRIRPGIRGTPARAHRRGSGRTHRVRKPGAGRGCAGLAEGVRIPGGTEI